MVHKSNHKTINWIELKTLNRKFKYEKSGQYCTAFEQQDRRKKQKLWADKIDDERKRKEKKKQHNNIN